jgi:hypothetical protein
MHGCVRTQELRLYVRDLFTALDRELIVNKARSGSAKMFSIAGVEVPKIINFEMGIPDGPVTPHWSPVVFGDSYLPAGSMGHDPPPVLAQRWRTLSCKQTCRQCLEGGCLSCAECGMRLSDVPGVAMYAFVQSRAMPAKHVCWFVVGDKVLDCRPSLCCVFDASKVPHGVFTQEPSPQSWGSVFASSCTTCSSLAASPLNHTM